MKCSSPCFFRPTCFSFSFFFFFFVAFPRFLVFFPRGGENLRLKLDRVGLIARARGELSTAWEEKREFLEGETVKTVL